MKQHTFRTTPAIIIATGALLLSATGGAVAAGMITGADIKNGTVSTKDIKNETIRLGDISAGAESALQGATGPAGPVGAPGISGLEIVSSTTVVESGAHGAAVVYCPGTKMALGISAYFAVGVDPIQTNLDATRGTAWGYNAQLDDNPLRIEITCANVT